MSLLKSTNLSNLDNNRNIIALMILENHKGKTIIQNLEKYGIVCTESQFCRYIKEHPISKFEIKMGETLKSFGM
jgi:hypothetical protein